MRRGERYGKSAIARPQGPIIWAHAASVGETVAITPLIERIAATGIHIVLTTGTVTSAKVVADQLGNKVIHQYAPLDLQPAVNKFLNHWKPDLAIGCESEVWPATVLSLAVAIRRRFWLMGACPTAPLQPGRRDRLWPKRF